MLNALYLPVVTPTRPASATVVLVERGSSAQSAGTAAVQVGSSVPLSLTTSRQASERWDHSYRTLIPRRKVTEIQSRFSPLSLPPLARRRRTARIRAELQACGLTLSQLASGLQLDAFHRAFRRVADLKASFGYLCQSGGSPATSTPPYTQLRTSLPPGDAGQPTQRKSPPEQING